MLFLFREDDSFNLPEIHVTHSNQLRQPLGRCCPLQISEISIMKCLNLSFFYVHEDKRKQTMVCISANHTCFTTIFYCYPVTRRLQLWMKWEPKGNECSQNNECVMNNRRIMKIMALRKKNKHKLIGAHMRTDHFSITICLFSERDSSSASLRGSCSWPKGTSGSQSHIRSFVTLETEK